MTRSRRSDRHQLELGEQATTLVEGDDLDEEDDDPCLTPEWCEGPENAASGRLCFECWKEATPEQREAFANAEPAAGQSVGVSRRGP
jgi:hypothetical protein